MIPLTVHSKQILSKQKVWFVIYAKKDLVLIMTIKNTKSEITVIILENVEVLPIIF